MFESIEKKYDVILADPPWKYRNWSKRGEGKGAAGQYDTMAVDDIMLRLYAELKYNKEETGCFLSDLEDVIL